jgi:Yip1 domain
MNAHVPATQDLSVTRPSEPPLPSGLTEAQRIVNVFSSPSKTFQDINRSGRWLVPFLLIAIVPYVVVFAVDRKIGFAKVAENEMRLNPRTADKLDQAPADQRTQQISIGTTITKALAYMSGPSIFLTGLTLAWIFMGSITWGLGKKISFGKSLAVVMYAWLPSIIKGILTIAVIFAQPEHFTFSNPLGTNPAFYLDVNATQHWLYTLLSFADVFTVWYLVLLAIGFSAVAGVKRSESMIVVFGWWAVLIVVSTGLSGLF